MSKVIIIILYIYITQIICEKKTSSCNYNDCFSCVACGGTNLESCNCSWSPDNRCQEVKHDLTISDNELKKKTSLNFNFMNNFLQCTDEASLSQQAEYCGNTIINFDDKKDKDEYIINLAKKDNEYGFRNLYCEYKYILQNPIDYYHTINLQVKSGALKHLSIYIDLLDINSNFSGLEINEENFSEKIKNIKELKLKIYCQQKFDELPFSFTLNRYKIKRGFGLYIDIAIILLVSILCGGTMYFITFKIAQKEKLELKYLQKSQMTNTSFDYNNNNIVIIKENNKKIKILFDTKLAPQIFKNNTHKIYCPKCNICGERLYENKSKVSITQCNHVFHYKCLFKWIHTNAKNPKCPCCKYSFLKEGPEPQREIVKEYENPYNRKESANVLKEEERNVTQIGVNLKKNESNESKENYENNDNNSISKSIKNGKKMKIDEHQDYINNDNEDSPKEKEYRYVSKITNSSERQIGVLSSDSHGSSTCLTKKLKK